MKKNIGLILSLLVIEPLFQEFGVQLPVFTEIMLLIALFLGIILTGTKHAYHYALRSNNALTLNRRQQFVIGRLELHSTQVWYEFSLFALLILAGVDPLKVIGVQFLARVPFQGVINWGVGKPFIDKNEPRVYAITRNRYFSGIQNFFRKIANLPPVYPVATIHVKKFLPGYWSLLKPVIGIILIYISFKLSGTYA